MNIVSSPLKCSLYTLCTDYIPKERGHGGVFCEWSVCMLIFNSAVVVVLVGEGILRGYFLSEGREGGGQYVRPPLP